MKADGLNTQHILRTMGMGTGTGSSNSGETYLGSENQMNSFSDSFTEEGVTWTGTGIYSCSVSAYRENGYIYLSGFLTVSISYTANSIEITEGEYTITLSGNSISNVHASGSNTDISPNQQTAGCTLTATANGIRLEIKRTTTQLDDNGIPIQLDSIITAISRSFCCEINYEKAVQIHSAYPHHTGANIL